MGGNTRISWVPDRSHPAGLLIWRCRIDAEPLDAEPLDAAGRQLKVLANVAVVT
ncbi:hypothetical protein AB0O52_10645 [Arthrobacter sp. NPDC080073]|uniref:hypothetical protein n=1 Tax=Arthrobacter sp. NPDC080073 TaxID=3155919 RepID=UPI00343F5B77